jgi:hypothetical protein
MHLLRIVPGLKLVTIHPDGEHAKTFDFLGRLGKLGLVRETAVGMKDYAVYKGPGRSSVDTRDQARQSSELAKLTASTRRAKQRPPAARKKRDTARPRSPETLQRGLTGSP